MAKEIDETKWKDAQLHVEKEYPAIEKDSHKFWKIVQTIYKNLSASDNPTTDIHAIDPERL